MKIHAGWRPVSGVILEPQGVTSDVQGMSAAARSAKIFIGLKDVYLKIETHVS